MKSTVPVHPRAIPGGAGGRGGVRGPIFDLRDGWIASAGVPDKLARMAARAACGGGALGLHVDVLRTTTGESSLMAASFDPRGNSPVSRKRRFPRAIRTE